MKDNKPLVITTALFIALLFLSSTASEYKPKNPNRPAFWGSSKEPEQAIKTSNKSTQSLHKRLDRFVESRRKIDANMVEKRKQIRRSTGSKRDACKRQLSRLQQRRDRLTKRIGQIVADIERIEGTKVAIK